MNIYEQLKLHEGVRLRPYKDSLGYLTIGVGRNLDANGISEEEAMILLVHDVQRVTEAVKRTFSWYMDLNEVRQKVIIDMVFNLGLIGFSKFTMTIKLLEIGNYKNAAENMLQSIWAHQVGKRARTLSKMMETGEEQL